MEADKKESRSRCEVLLFGLLFLMVSFPILSRYARPIYITTAIAGVLLAGVIAVRPGRQRIRNSFILAAVQVLLTFFASQLSEGSSYFEQTIIVAMVSTGAMIIHALYSVFRYVLESRRITTDQIYAGVSVYLMLGFAFGAVFYLINLLTPGAFVINSPALEQSGNLDLMYFSFITLATVGFGDVTPVAPFARSLTQLEAILGSLYMAVFMARLVSLRVSE
jgi:hypothetical protein